MVVVYYREEPRAPVDGKTVRVVSPNSDDQQIAAVKFRGFQAQYFGAPNDEAFEGHPLAARGLEPYGAFEVLNSSWIRALSRMNEVHSNHSDDMFRRLRHFVLTFHDTTFECVARDFTVRRGEGSLRAAALSALEDLM